MEVGVMLTETDSGGIGVGILRSAEQLGHSWALWEWKNFCVDTEVRQWGKCITG